MLFHPRNRTRSPNKKRLLVVVAIFVVGAFFFSYFNGALLRIATPVWAVESGISNKFWSLTNFFRTKNALIMENESLKQEVAADRLRLLESSARENAVLSFSSAYTKQGNRPGVAAGVLVRPPQTPYDVLVVGAGENAGLKVGDIVTLPEGPKIGKIIEVSSKTSRVLLYSANNEKTGAVLERNAVPIELVGQGGGTLIFNLPREQSVEVGDKILEPTIEGSLIGIVRDIEVTPTDSFKKVYVESIAPVNSLRFILIAQ